MGCASSKPNIEPSVPIPEKPQQPPQPTPIVRDRKPSAAPPKPKPDTAKKLRERAQSHSAATSKRRRNDDLRSHPLPSGGTGAIERTRSVSMDTTAQQNTPSSVRRNRTASQATAIYTHKRVGTKSMSGLPSATGQIPSGRQGGRSRFPFALQSLLPNDFRFRILVVGKRECGKSSLIRTIFKVDMSRSPINVSGRTDEFRPPDNRHLIVHECSVFGPREMQAIRDFIMNRNDKGRPDSEKLHAIWICVPMSDLINGQVDQGVKTLLDLGVPVVIAVTMLDVIASNVLSSHEELCRSQFGNVPAEIVSTKPKFRRLVNKLVATTDGVIIAHSRNTSAALRTQPRSSPVSLAWSVSQRASSGINVQAAIEVGRSRYWRRLWSSDDFVGQPLANCVEIIHADIIGTWNMPNKDKYLSSTAFRAEISYIVQDITGSPINTSPRHGLDGTPGTGAAWLNGRYENSNENICHVMGYIVDLILILCSVFKSPGVSPGEVQNVINNFAGSSLKTSVHNDISSFIRTVPQFQYYDNDVVMAKIIDLISRNCDPPPGNSMYR